MSNRRKPKKPWLAMGPAGTVAGSYQFGKMFTIPNRRRKKNLDRRVHVIQKILDGKMVAPSERP